MSEARLIMVPCATPGGGDFDRPGAGAVPSAVPSAVPDSCDLPAIVTVAIEADPATSAWLAQETGPADTTDSF